MRWANIGALGVKELRGLVRDPVLMVLIVYAFTLSVYTVSTATPETLTHATIAIVDEDHSPLSERLTSAFYPPSFTPPVLISGSQMDARMDAGIDTFALDIPPDFQRDLIAGRSPEVQLNVDATRLTQAFSGSGYVRAIVAGEIADFLGHRASALPTADLDLRARFNPNLQHFWFGAVTSIIDNVTMLSIILTGAAIMREREHGTIEHLLVMPVTPLEIMASKVWSMGLVVLLFSLLSLIVVVQGVLGVPIQGSLGLFFAGAALDVIATTAMGIALATAVESMPQFALLLMLVLLPMQVLSGAISPRESMPAIIRDIMLLAPNTHFVSLAQSVLFRGAGLDVVWPQLASLAAIGTVLFLFSLRRFRSFLK